MSLTTPIVVAVVWLWLTRRAIQHRRGGTEGRAAPSPAPAATLAPPVLPGCVVDGCGRPAGPLGRCLPHS